MIMPKLPLELQELVIDMVYDGNYKILTATLRSCSLTCRAWLPRSKGRLYQVLEFYFARRTQLDQLVNLIDRDTEVSSAVRQLVVGRSWPAINPEPGDIVHAGAVLVTLAGKLPRLRSLEIWNTVIASSPSRLPELGGFRALTTLELWSVYFTSYVAFRRMLSAAPGLRRLLADSVFLTSTHISPTIQYDRLRCPPLTHLAWYQLDAPERMEQSSVPLSHIIRNMHIRQSLEYLALRDLTRDFVDQIITSVLPDPYTNPVVLPKLCTLKLHMCLRDVGETEDEISGTFDAFLRLIATLWPSGTRTPRGRMLTFALRYKRSTLLPVSHTGSTEAEENGPTDDVLERLLRALKDVGTELERLLAATDRERLGAVTFLFTDDKIYNGDVSGKDVREFMVPLRSRMAGIFPGLHRLGLLKTRFRTGHAWMLDWVEDRMGNFEGVPPPYTHFD